MDAIRDPIFQVAMRDWPSHLGTTLFLISGAMPLWYGTQFGVRKAANAVGITHPDLVLMITLVIAFGFLFVYLIALRHYYLVKLAREAPGTGDAPMVRSSGPHYVLMVCGSGGHTAEMLQMIERSIRPEKCSHRRWAIGQGDHMSYDKVMAFERRLAERFSKRNVDAGSFDIVWFQRARAVHQSWTTTPFTAVSSFVGIFRILVTPPARRPIPAFRYPGVIVTNGPGTGFVFLVAAHLLKIFFVVPDDHMKSIFVESWARVTSLSLSGKLIHWFNVADLFIVQWPGLAKFGVHAANMPAMPVDIDDEF